MSNGLIADDRSQPWWNKQYAHGHHIMVNPVPSAWTGQGAQSYSHAVNFPQVYRDYMPSSTTVAYAQSQAAVPGAIVGPAFPKT